jgi:hypothetical protein
MGEGEIEVTHREAVQLMPLKGSFPAPLDAHDPWTVQAGCHSVAP